MKSFIRWTATLALIGGTVLTSWLGYSLKVLALPQEQIVKVFQPIPVFTIVNEQGTPLIAVAENKTQVLGIFISQQDAQKFLQQAQKQQPDVVKQYKVQIISLAQAYELAQKIAQAPEKDKIVIDYVPNQTEVESAKKLLSAKGQQYQSGVPIYSLKVGSGDKQGYVVIKDNNEQVIPFFFEESQAQAIGEAFKKQNPQMAASVTIEVSPLEGLIQFLEKTNEKDAGQIRLFPSKESQAIIQQLLQKQPSQPSANPAPTSEKK